MKKISQKGRIISSFGAIALLGGFLFTAVDLVGNQSNDAVSTIAEAAELHARSKTPLIGATGDGLTEQYSVLDEFQSNRVTHYDLSYVLRGTGDLATVIQSPTPDNGVYDILLGFTRVAPNGDVLVLTFDPAAKKVTSVTAYTKKADQPTLKSLIDPDSDIGEYGVEVTPAADATMATLSDQAINTPLTVGNFEVTVDEKGAFTVKHTADDGSTDTLSARKGSRQFAPNFVFNIKYTAPTQTTNTSGNNPATTTGGGGVATPTWSIHGHDGTSTTNGTVTPTNFDGYAVSSTGDRQPVTVDTSKVDFTKPGTYPVTLNGEGVSKIVQLTVSSPYLSGQTGLGQLIPGTAVREGQAVYAVKGIYLYSKPTFVKQNRKIHYTKHARINRPMFVVTGYTRSKTGAVRYIVRDVNHTWKTDGKKGYITANANFVQPVYYSSVPSSKTITVIATKGINTYRNVNLTGKAKHYKTGVHLRVKKIVKYHLTTRYILSNGQYLTTNKKLIIAGRY